MGKKGFDIKEDVIKPIATGVAVFIPIQIIAWILELIGLAPFIGGATLNTAPQGIAGLGVLLWGTGKFVPKIPELIEGLMKKRR
jgi:hypothetical protein